MLLQRLDRLAILMVGVQHTGKTTTLKTYFDYYHEEVSGFKQGWRYKVTPFRPKYEAIKIWPYVLPSSRTERGTPLNEVIDLKWLPDVLFMAEQLYGSHHPSSLHFLMKHEYHIKEFVLSNVVGPGVWDRWESGNKVEEEGKLLQRREQVADYVRQI